MSDKQQSEIELVPQEPGASSLRNREDPTLALRAKQYRDDLFAGEVAAIFGAALGMGFLLMLLWGGFALFNSHPNALAIILAAFGFPGLGLIVHILGGRESSDS